VIQDSMPYDLSKVKDTVTEARKLRKWPISDSFFSVGIHVMKRLRVNYELIQDNV